MTSSDASASADANAIDDDGRAELDGLLARSPVPHAVVDATGVVRAGNAAFASLVERDAFIGKPFIAVVPLVQSDLFWRVLRCACDEHVEGAFDGDVFVGSGAHRRLHTIAAPLTGNAALLALVDVGAHARAEAEAREAREVELRMRAQMEALTRAHLTIGQAASLPNACIRDVLHVIAEQARDVLDADLGAIGLGDEDDPRSLRPFTCVGVEAGGAEGDVDSECATKLAARAAAEPKNVIRAPMRLREKEVGALFVADPRDRDFDALDERLVRMLAQRAAAAIETVRSLEREATQRAWLQAVIDKMPEYVIVADANGGLLANEMARSLSASAPGEPPRYDVRTAAGVPIAREDMPFERALRGESVTDLDVVVHAADRNVPVLVNAAPIVDARGNRIGAVCLCRDITALRALEKMREEWAAVIAHDLRQPLSVIRVSDEVLARSAASANAATSRAIERIRVAARRMWTMIEELVDSSLIEAHRLRVVKAPTCIGAIAREVVEQMAEQLVGRDVIVEAAPDDETVVAADEARIVQVIGNLLSNAVKYGSPGTPICVRVHSDERVLRLAVENHGKPIPSSELQRMFSRFFRTGEAASSSARGLGLGLYIVQGLVHGHGGEIVASCENGVTRFEITLPR